MNGAMINESVKADKNYGMIIENKEMNIPQLISHLPSERLETKQIATFKFNITDNRLKALSNLSIKYTIDKIKGDGEIRFIEWFGFRLINKLNIYSDNKLIKSITGFEMCQNYIQANGLTKNTRVGHDNRYYYYSRGTFCDDVVFDSMELNIPVFSSWDLSLPISVLPVLPGVLKMEIEFNRIEPTLVKRVESDLSIPMFPSNPQVIFKHYTTKDSIDKRVNIEMIEETKGEYNDNKIVITAPFDSLTAIYGRVCSDNFDHKTFITYPEGSRNFQSFKRAYEEAICGDIITSIDEDNCCNLCSDDKWDGKSHNKNCKAQAILTRKYDPKGLGERIFVKNPSHITIVNAPNIFVLTNPLTFMRKGGYKPFSVYPYIDSITGILRNDNKIAFVRIESRITSNILSIPVELWTDPNNISLGDLRSVEGKKHDVVLTDHWVSGLDFFSDYSGLENIVITAGPDIKFHKSHQGGLSEYNGHRITPATFHLNNMYEDTHHNASFSFFFNENDLNFFTPTRIRADKNKNFFNCSVETYWKEYSLDDPFSLIKRYMIVYYSQPISILTTGNSFMINNI